MEQQDLQAENARMMDAIIEQDERIKKLKAWNEWFFKRVQFMRSCQKEYYSMRLELKKLETTDPEKAKEKKLECVEMLKKCTSVEQEIDREITRIKEAVEAREHKQAIDEAKQMLIDQYGFEETT